MNDLVPLLRKSIDIVQARRELNSKRLDFKLARLELLRAAKELRDLLPDAPLPGELSDIATISNELRDRT